MLRVSVNPELLRWARERAGRDAADFGDRFKKLPQWEAGAEQPTLTHLRQHDLGTSLMIWSYVFAAWRSVTLFQVG